MIHDDTLTALRELQALHSGTATHHRDRASSIRLDVEHHEAEAAKHTRIAVELGRIIERAEASP